MRMFGLAAALLVASATTVAAQANDPDRLAANGGVKVPGWTGRVDPQAAARGATIANASFVAAGSGFHITSGPAAIYWNPANSVPGGNYTVSATFTQTKAADHPEAYGIFLGGQNLESANQSYLYFLVRQDGQYLINHRASDTEVHRIVQWTKHDAVKPMDASGRATNALAIVVGPDKLSFQVNGTEVWNVDRSTIDAGGGHSGTSGIVGIRVNHNLDVHVENFGIERR